MVYGRRNTYTRWWICSRTRLVRYNSCGLYTYTLGIRKTIIRSLLLILLLIFSPSYVVNVRYGGWAPDRSNDVFVQSVGGRRVKTGVNNKKTYTFTRYIKILHPPPKKKNHVRIYWTEFNAKNDVRKYVGRFVIRTRFNWPKFCVCVFFFSITVVVFFYSGQMG